MNEVLGFISYLQDRLKERNNNIALCLGFLEAHIPLCVDGSGVYLRKGNEKRYLKYEELQKDDRIIEAIEETLHISMEQKRALYRYIASYSKKKEL